jgi:hypothetical protein
MEIKNVVYETRTINGERVDSARVELNVKIPEDERLTGYTQMENCILTLYKPSRVAVLEQRLNELEKELQDKKEELKAFQSEL